MGLLRNEPGGILTMREWMTTGLTSLNCLTRPFDRLQTPVYALYPVPAIVCAAILLSTRKLGISLPSNPPDCWWELFDAEWDDVWSIAGYIMRLYRTRTTEELRRPLGLLTKKDVRRWIEQNVPQKSLQGMEF